MIFGKLDIYLKNNEIGPIRHNISVDNDTLDFSPMTLIIKAKMKKVDYNKLNSFCTERN